MDRGLVDVTGAAGVQRLVGVTRPYAWGGRSYIAELLRIDAEGPLAEYWLGAHPSAPSRLGSAEGPTLDRLVAAEPGTWLGDAGDEWPFLFKVLDVAAPLSIQVHPDARQARVGFDAEEAAGIPRDAPYRNFRDPNPKPELAVAIDPFWLLFGIAADELLAERLARYPSLAPLGEVLRAEGGAAVFATVLRAGPMELGRWLAPVLEAARQVAAADPSTPEYWLRTWVGDRPIAERIDRGVFGFLLMNILRLEPGEGIFQGPGVPHAYLSGRIIELMTCSDNVLRCGLTGKHVDPEAVLAHVDLTAHPPTLVSPLPADAPGRDDYVCPVDDFLLSRIRLAAGERSALASRGPAILLALEGLVQVADGLTLQRGESAIVRPGEPCELLAVDASELYVATVPLNAI